MAAVAPPADQAAGLLQNLSLDSQIETPNVPKKTSADTGNVANGIQSDRSATPILPDPTDPAMFYPPNGYASAGYFYGGYDASGNEWEDYTKYMTSEGVDMNPGAYGDNGSLVYHHGYGYAPYNPYSPAASPVPTMGHDGQMYGAQPYQYPNPYFQSLTPTSGAHPNQTVPAKGEIANTTTADQAPLDSASTKSNSFSNNGGGKGNSGTNPVRSAYHNASYNGNGYGGALSGSVPASTYQDPRFGFDGLNSPMPWLENPYFSDGYSRPVNNSSVANGNGVPSSRSNSFRPQFMGSHHSRPFSGMNTASGYTSSMYPSKLYGQYDHSYRSSLAYGANGYDARSTGRGWMAVDSKYRPRGRGNGFYGYGNESVDGLNELNRGPRAKSSKNQKGFSPVALVVKGQNIDLTETTENEKEKPSAMPDREQYNLSTFSETYSEAKFFIIKSYSEDDVHKSIKYNVWASTPNGNKKLDAAYLDAQQKPGGCPVFLFFSVNTSGQFVGVAEMVGPVDFDKSVEYWQQDKWIGCFPVKWHIVKDVPNSLLKHITLEYNENKPVTNSRDTQEVKLEQGLQVIKIFKDHSSKQCILDDFDFYEDRQKRIQEKKAKQQQFQKQAQQVWEGKHAEEKNKASTNGYLKPQKPSEVASGLNRDAASFVRANGDTEIRAQEKVLGNGVTE